MKYIKIAVLFKSMGYDMKCASTFFLLLFFFDMLAAQNTVLKGKIYDENTGQTIPFAYVYIKGTHRGTTSDNLGQYQLVVPDALNETTICFQHIAYKTLEMPLDSLKDIKAVYLTAKLIRFEDWRIEAKKSRLEISKDIPQSIGIIDGKNLAIKGFTDAAEPLRMNQSVQLNEDIGGKKTVMIRGGNADDVLVLYNGVVMNNLLDNAFDCSIIDPDGMERIEIIKGSNSALYGAGAVSGVINMVPKVAQDYFFRFYQKIGSYRSGQYGISLYKNIKNLYGFLSFKRAGSKKQFIDIPDNTAYMHNDSEHQKAHLIYHLSENPDGSAKSSTDLMFIRSSLGYYNQRSMENVSRKNQLISLKYNGNLVKSDNWTITSSYILSDEDQDLVLSGQTILKKIHQRNYIFNIEKAQKISYIDFLWAYQAQAAQLDFKGDSDYDYFHRLNLTRGQHGFLMISKLHAPTEARFIPSIEFDLSIRHDRVQDQKSSNTSITEPGSNSSDKNRWSDTTWKFSIQLVGHDDRRIFNSFFNFGNNIKFPTLLQQVSHVPHSFASLSLQPEKSNSTEFGVQLGKQINEEPGILDWQVSAAYFRNSYSIKFRPYYIPGLPITFYDYIQNAKLKGIEAEASIYLLRGKVIVDVGVSKYSIPNRAAFPFKFENKYTVDLKLEHSGFYLQPHLFYESEQIGWVRQSTDKFMEIILPDQFDLDVHFGKNLNLGKLELFAAASLFNLLGDDIELEGLALRDRKIYFTMGFQY